MVHLIKEIKLSGESYSFIDDDNTPTDIIKKLSKINIFVGENNSGKSRLLRELLLKELNYIPTTFSIMEMNECIGNIQNEFENYFKDKNFTPISELMKCFQQIKKFEYIDDSVKLYDWLNDIKVNLESIMVDTSRNWGGFKYSRAGKDLMEIFDKHMSNFIEIFEANLLQPEFMKIYIPILRGLRPINFVNGSFQNEDVYGMRTKNDYFGDLQNPFEIFSGLSSYGDIRSSLLGDLHQRTLIKDYEKYLSENFFENQPLALIPSENYNVLTIKIGDEKEQPIYNLGDGIQTIIILTMPLFLHKGKNLLIFIEEPEQLIHPGLQRKLISSLLYHEGFENYQYFMTTHSNHFLDITLDYSGISVYTSRKKFKNNDNIEKIPSFHIENLSQGDSSSLELLGVRNSSVFLSNCTIWVEGITDRLYFRHYLNLYIEYLNEQNTEDFTEIKEDFHYSFVEYSGNNITHWSFLNNEEMPINVERLCGRLFLIADKDENKTERHGELKKILGDRFCLLECREVENLLSKNILLKIITEYEGEEPDIQDFNELDYKDELLGQFIENKLNTKKRKGSYKTSSGTIGDKVGFCKKALKNVNKWNELSSDAKEVCRKMYDFIVENNK